MIEYLFLIEIHYSLLFNIHVFHLGLYQSWLTLGLLSLQRVHSTYYHIISFSWNKLSADVCMCENDEILVVIFYFCFKNMSKCELIFHRNLQRTSINEQKNIMWNEISQF